MTITSDWNTNLNKDWDGLSKWDSNCKTRILRMWRFYDTVCLKQMHCKIGNKSEIETISRRFSIKIYQIYYFKLSSCKLDMYHILLIYICTYILFQVKYHTVQYKYIYHTPIYKVHIAYSSYIFYL